VTYNGFNHGIQNLFGVILFDTAKT
jgi:hypothetical protein